MSLVEKKQEADFTKEVDEVETQIDSLAKAGSTQQALELILALEKKTRNAADLVSTMRLLLFAVLLLRATPSVDKPQWEQLNETIIALSKRHGQLKQAITKMVSASMCFLYAPGIGETGKRQEEQAAAASAVAAAEDTDDVEMKPDAGTSKRKEDKETLSKQTTKEAKEDKEKHGEASHALRDEKRQKMKAAIEVDEDRGEGTENEAVARLMERAKSIGDQGTTEDMKFKLVETIRSVTEGKVRRDWWRGCGALGSSEIQAQATRALTLALRTLPADFCGSGTSTVDPSPCTNAGDAGQDRRSRREAR